MAEVEGKKDVGKLLEQAKRHCLQEVASTSNAQSVLVLAEAYAWLTSAQQPHGGSARSG